MPRELEKLIQQKKDALESIPDDFVSSIDKANEKAFQDILKELKKLETTGSDLTFNKENLARIDVIMNKLRESLFGGEYYTALKLFIAEIQVQANLTNSILSKSVNFTNESDYNALVKKSQHNVLLLFDDNAITANIIQPLTDVLTDAIASKTNYLQAVDNLRKALTGTDSYLSKYANTYAKDAFARTDRQYAQLVSKDFGIEFYKYDGALIRGSRYFCCSRKGGYYHRKEVESWGDDAALWDKPADAGKCANKKGGGRDPDTNASNIFTLLGGFGCIDVLIPMAIDYVPKNWIDRAKSLGYYSE